MIHTAASAPLDNESDHQRLVQLIKIVIIFSLSVRRNDLRMFG
jgi:hypothetical protein